MWLLLEIKAACTVAAIQWPLIVVMENLVSIKGNKIDIIFTHF